MRQEKSPQKDTVEMLHEEYINATQLPLTPSNGLRRAQILAKLAMLSGGVSLPGQKETEASAATDTSVGTPQGRTLQSLPF